MKNYHCLCYYYYSHHYSKFPVYITLTIGMTVMVGLSLLHFSDLYRVNIFAYSQNDSSTTDQNIAIAQGFSSSSRPIVCNHPLLQQGILAIYTQIQDLDHFVKVPVNTLSFTKSAINNGEVNSFNNLRLSNPLTVCVNPGTFTITETGTPAGFTFGQPTYSLTGTDNVIHTNTPCSENISAGKYLTCTIANTVTGMVPTTKPNSTVFTTTESNATTLSVLGTASANVKPDKVTLLLGVETTNKTATEAILANSKLMNRVLYVLKAVGVKDNETSTSSFNISPDYSQIGTQANITGFTANNVIKLESTTITNVSNWIDLSIKAGANRVNSIYFSLSDRKLDETKNVLIENAINDAQKKANITASTLGLKVVGVKSINLDIFEYNMPTDIPRVTPQGIPANAISSSTTSPIIPGEQQISQQVSIIFLLER